MQLAIPVFDPDEPGRPLLKRNYALTDAVIERLNNKGVVSLWVRYPALSRVEEFVSLPGIQAQTALVKEITGAFESIQEDSNARLQYAEYTQTLSKLVEALIEKPKTALFLGDLMRSQNYLLNHSANVAYLSVLLGLKLEGYLIKQRKHVAPRRAKEVVPLGLGGMLHDIGVPLLDQDVQACFMEDGDEEDKFFREHTALGFDRVRGELAPAAACAILHHHQRMDGEGYTGRRFPTLGGERIHIFARIVAVADRFDHLRNPPIGESRHTLEAMRQMLGSDGLSAFDHAVLKALLLIAPPFPQGSIVRLSDGRSAAVTEHIPTDPCRPTVQIIDKSDPEAEGGDVIKLSEFGPLEASGALVVAEHDGKDVSDWLFMPPPEVADPASIYC